MVEGKKKRITTACDHCRSKRTKCDGKSPCTNCSRNGTKCTYFKKSKKRGLPTGYISNLEVQVNSFNVLLGYFVMLKDKGGLGFEAVIKQSLQQPHTIVCLSNEAALTWKNSPASSMFMGLSRFCKSKELGVKESELSKIEPLQDDLSFSPYIDELGIQPEPSTFRSSDISQSVSSESMSGLPTSVEFEEFAFVDIDYESLLSNDIFHFSPEGTDILENNLPTALQYHGFSQQMSGFSGTSIHKYSSHLGSGDRNPFRVGTIFGISSSLMLNRARQAGQIKVPLEIYRFSSRLRSLVESYFLVYHPCMPMLDRGKTLGHLNRLQGGDLESPDLEMCSIISLIWAIMALMRADKSPSQSANFARNSVLALECAPVTTVETIQSMIILGLYFYKVGEWDNAWVLILSSSRMAIDVRLMRTSKKDKCSYGVDDNARERTWATVYFMNTFLAARMGRSPLVRATDWPIPKVPLQEKPEWDSLSTNPDSEPLNHLSIFNELLKIMALLNSALTCNLDSENLSRNTALNTIFVLDNFQREMSKWNAELPANCRLDADSPPMVAYLHMCSNMVWITICVRLMHITTELGIPLGDIIDTRNLKYTWACVSNRQILDLGVKSELTNFPFMDYFILMSLNFSSMMLLNPLESAKHTSKTAHILETALKLSVSCRITWDIYRIDNGIEIENSEANSDDLVGLRERPRQVTSQFPSYPVNLNTNEDPVNLKSLQINNTFHSKRDASKRRFSPYNQASGKEELDLFMLDTDSAKSDGRFDNFLRNLGFVAGMESNKDTNTIMRPLMNQSDLRFTLSGQLTSPDIGT